MINKKKKNILIFGIIILILFICFFPSIISSWRWQKAVEASAGFPVQLGLTKAVIVPCVFTPPPVGPACVGGLPLCSRIVDPVSCPLHSQVSGLPAGGNGSMALFSKIAITKAGLTPGGQLIAGGMSHVAMDNGVLASAGGCFGCITKANFKDKIFDLADKIDKYIIAVFR
ncbi:MAG: hypothetical protein ABIJ83_02190 [Patescibacteria group bacterium]|nr:hypothetical protein [Patescibacteria group bacterium]